MSAKKWGIITLTLTLLLLLVLGGLTAVIDPFFHYHAPLDSLAYEMLNTKQRYYNDGIGRNFDYDILLTGTSMTENFNASFMDEVFGGKSVKLPYEGASLKEVDRGTKAALAANPDIRLVIRSLDYFVIVNDKDDMLYDTTVFPDYLYDDNIFNDLNYVLNKTVLFENTLHTLRRTASGEKMTDFDEYSRMSPMLFGVRLEESAELPVRKEQDAVSPELLSSVEANVLQNLRQTALDNPQTEFYYFMSPYSVVHWASYSSAGLMDTQIEAMRKTAEMLVDIDNVRLFAFDDRLDMICQLEHYMDDGCHFDAVISDMIVADMAAGKNKLTAENYNEYFDSLYYFFRNTDFRAYLN